MIGLHRGEAPIDAWSVCLGPYRSLLHVSVAVAAAALLDRTAGHTPCRLLHLITMNKLLVPSSNPTRAASSVYPLVAAQRFVSPPLPPHRRRLRIHANRHHRQLHGSLSCTHPTSVVVRPGANSMTIGTTAKTFWGDAQVALQKFCSRFLETVKRVNFSM